MRALRGPGWLACLVLLAGCAQSPAPTATDAAPPAPDAAGSIIGQVVDDEQVPQPGADVHLVAEPPRAAITDPAGRFRFDGLDPGRYTIRAVLAGHEAADVDVELGEGETRSITLHVQRVAAPVPHVSTYVDNAIIEFGVNAMGIYHYANTSGTQYRDIFYPLREGAVSAVVGLEWSATSPVSAKRMYLALFLSTDQCEVWCKLIAESHGRSRLLARSDDVAAAREGRDNLTVNPYIAISPGCVIATASSCAAQPDAAVQVAQDQRFRIVTSVFYVEPAAPGYSPFAT